MPPKRLIYKAHVLIKLIYTRGKFYYELKYYEFIVYIILKIRYNVRDEFIVHHFTMYSVFNSIRLQLHSNRGRYSVTNVNGCSLVCTFHSST